MLFLMELQTLGGKHILPPPSVRPGATIYHQGLLLILKNDDPEHAGGIVRTYFLYSTAL